MHTNLISTVLLLFAITEAMAQTVPAIDDEFGLRAIGPVKVIVDVPRPATGTQLSPSVLLTQVELRLRQAGVAVVTPDAPGAPILSVIVNVTDAGAMVQAYSVRVSLWQVVRLARPPNTVVSAATWYSREAVGYAPTDQVAAFVRQALADEVDQYINQWLAANPRRQPSNR